VTCYNRVFIDATALASEARLHAELCFKLGLPSDYAANWDALVDCVSSIGDPDAHLCRYWEYTPTKRLSCRSGDSHPRTSIRLFSRQPQQSPAQTIACPTVP
jgi:Barstar (barnase inhibitor)